MSRSSTRRKQKRLMYRNLKKTAIKKGNKPLPKDAPVFQAYKPRVVRALSRVIEFESRKPGEFGAWLTDLHIEHWCAGIQDKLDKAKLERENEQEKDSEDHQK